MRPRLVHLLLLVCFACGQDDAGIGQRASAALAPQVQQVRAAASSADRAEAQRKLVELRQTVAHLRRSGELSEAGASRVLAAATEVEVLLGSTALAPSTTAHAPTTQASPTTAAPAEAPEQRTKEEEEEEKREEREEQEEREQEKREEQEEREKKEKERAEEKREDEEDD